jgi:HK97 family phage portal protein
MTMGNTAVPILSGTSALRYTPVWRATTLISNDIARVSSEVSNPSAEALWKYPNRWQSAFEFRRSMTMQALLYGNAFALINRTRGGEFLELLPLDPESVTLDLTGADPVYKTSSYGTLPLSSVLHLRTPGYNGLWGESPIRLCSVSMSIMAAQENMALEAYRNAANPKVALIHPGPLSPEARQRIMQDYANNHAGTINTGKPVVLAEGMKVERISSTLDDTGLAEARRYSIADVSRLYGVPVSYLSEHASSAYGTMEWLSRMYVDGCIAHWCATWQAEIVAKLAAPGDVMTWDLDQLTKPSLAETMAALRTGVESGVITRNEARARLDLPPLAGLDAPTLALNMGAGGGASNIGTDTSANAIGDFT